MHQNPAHQAPDDPAAPKTTTGHPTPTSAKPPKETSASPNDKAATVKQQAQVAFLNDFAQWAEDNDVLSALYFDANGTWDTRLTSSSSRSTYANIVAAGA